MAFVIDGQKIGESIRADLAKQVAGMVFPPSLAVVLMGDDPASGVYVQRKTTACKEVGIKSEIYHVDKTMFQAGLEKIIKQLNDLPWTDGILIQLPLPAHIDRGRIFDLIAPEKDVDVFSPINVGLLMQGRAKFLPCTPHGISLMLQHTKISVDGKHVVVINRSDIVGKPLSSMLIQDNPEFGNATVTVCHNKTPPSLLKEICLSADVIVVAVGIPGFLTTDMVKPGQVIVDVGITRVAGKILGDVAPGVADQVSYITPVPGGVGPMTVTSLLLNTVRAAMLRRE